jgi:hypothetical protein
VVLSLTLLRHGAVTFGGMLYYYAPGLSLAVLGYRSGQVSIVALGAVLCLVATIAIPGYMTHYCRAFDLREIYDPFRALSRVWQGGLAYWARVGNCAGGTRAVVPRPAWSRDRVLGE